MKKIVKKIVSILFIIATLAIVACMSISCKKSNGNVYVEETTTVESTVETTIETSEKKEEKTLVEKKPVEHKFECEIEGDTCFITYYDGGIIDSDKIGDAKIVDFSKNEGVVIDTCESMMANDCANSLYKYEEDKYAKVEEIYLTGLKLGNATSMKNMFLGLPSLKKIDFGDIDTSNITSMRGMFFKCENLEEIHMKNLNTINVVDMGYMFYKCLSLSSLDVSNFNTATCSDMSYMFGNCRSLTELDLSNFKTSGLSNMSHMFYRLQNVKKLDLSSFDTSYVAKMDYLFYSCYSLEEVNLSSFDIKNVDNMEYMFYFCNNLKSLNLSNFKNEKDVNIIYAFRYCESLKSLDLSNIDLSKVYGEYIFDGCNSLVDYKFNMESLNKNNEKSSFYYSSGVDFNILGNESLSSEKVRERIKKQIDDLSLNKNLSLYVDRKKNISNRDLFFMNNESWLKLLQNEFLVKKDSEYMEYFDFYEEDRYNHFPNFVTTDSMLHTFHLYFDALMKKIESGNLYNEIKTMTESLYERAKDEYEEAKDTIYENEAKIVLAYFAVPLKIFDNNFVPIDDITAIVDEEVSLINSHSESIRVKPIFYDLYNKYSEYYQNATNGDYDVNWESYFLDDYTQYKPRGHYDGDEKLEKYFKVFMWYGRTNFTSYIIEMNKCALLICKAMDNNVLPIKYENIKEVICYFAGESDDRSYDEYLLIIDKIYKDATNKEIFSDPDKFLVFCEEIKKSKTSKINSSPLTYEKDDNIINFRFFGQTYTYDEEIFDNFMSRLDRKSNGDKRYLPDFLDVPAVYDSNTAYKILKEKGDTTFPGYEETLKKLKTDLNNKMLTDDSNVLYVKWMKTLIDLLSIEKDNSKLPSFMKNNEWFKKTLETFAGSYAELKHDTILYTKQAYGAAECSDGGGDEYYDAEEVEIDTKGYVEPQVKVYEKLKLMAESLNETFGAMKMLNQEDIEFITNFRDLAEKLENISYKELNKETLSEEDYKLIEGYGATIEHLIVDSGAYFKGADYDYNPRVSSAIVADVATGDRSVGDLRVLEMATGNPIRIYVLVEVEGKYKVCQGAAYDFYQFEVEPDKRMTDVEWRTAMGFDTGYQKNADGTYGTHDTGWFSEDDEKPNDGSIYLSKEDYNNNFIFQTWTDSYKIRSKTFTERINTYYIDHCGGQAKKNICSPYEND